MSKCPLLLALLISLAAQTRHVEGQEIDANATELQEYLVIGTVVWVQPGASSISIRGASLLGRLRIQVKSYRVKQPSALINLHPGDKITAVFSRKDGMLHRLKRVQGAVKGDSH